MPYYTGTTFFLIFTNLKCHYGKGEQDAVMDILHKDMIFVFCIF